MEPGPETKLEENLKSYHMLVARAIIIRLYHWNCSNIYGYMLIWT